MHIPHPHRREKPSGRLSTSAPPRIGVRSRAAYEAERLMQWATGRPSVTPVKASTVSPVPEPVVQTPPPGSPRAVDLKKEVPATPPPTKAPFFSTPHHAEADVAAAASTRFRACWRRKGEKAYARAWSVPVLRELRVSAGAGPAAAPRVVPWERAAGRLRVELYAPEAASVGDDAARDIYRRAVEGDDLGLAPDGATLLGVELARCHALGPGRGGDALGEEVHGAHGVTHLRGDLVLQNLQALQALGVPIERLDEFAQQVARGARADYDGFGGAHGACGSAGSDNCIEPGRAAPPRSSSGGASGCGT